MIVQAEVGLYPLKTQEPGKQVEAFLNRLGSTSLQIHPGGMTTVTSGELRETFEALAESFAAIAERSPVVLVVKVSNACPQREQAD